MGHLHARIECGKEGARRRVMLVFVISINFPISRESKKTFLLAKMTKLFKERKLLMSEKDPCKHLKIN